jgi:ADP-heptose:LPS heptosyltransferase
MTVICRYYVPLVNQAPKPKKNKQNLLFPKCKTEQQVVAFFQNGIGDFFLALPALRALVDAYPYQVTLICGAEPTPWWVYDLNFRKIIEIETTRQVESFCFNLESIKSILARDCDIFISFSLWNSILLDDLKSHLQAKQTYGFHPSYTCRYEQNNHVHMSQQLLGVIKPLITNFLFNDYGYPPNVPASSRLIAEKQLYELRKYYPEKKCFLAIHTDTLVEKMWPSNLFTQCITEIKRIYPTIAILILGAKPIICCKTLDVIDFTGIPLSLTAALLAKIDFFLGIDSCLLHLADLFRIPCIGLYGPSNDKVYGMLYTRHIIVRAPHLTMNSLSVDLVTSAFNSLITATGSDDHCGLR